MSATTLASAQEEVIWDEDRRWFVTVQAGRAEHETVLEKGAEWWGAVDDRSTTYLVGLGYRVLPWLGVRIGYEWARSVEVRNICPPDAVCPAVVFTEPTDTRAATLTAVPRWRFASRWDLYGTAGLMRWHISPDDVIRGDRGTEPVAGAGIGYELANGVTLAVEYQETLGGADHDYRAARMSLSLSF